VNREISEKSVQKQATAFSISEVQLSNQTNWKC